MSVAFTSWATDDGGAQWSRGGSFSAVQDPGSSWPTSLDFVNVDDGWFSASEDDVDPSSGDDPLSHRRRRSALGPGREDRTRPDCVGFGPVLLAADGAFRQPDHGVAHRRRLCHRSVRHHPQRWCHMVSAVDRAPRHAVPAAGQPDVPDEVRTA